MWPKVWTWIKGKPLLAGIIVLAFILALSGAVDGFSARRVAAQYFDLIRGWQKAYERDIAASKKEYEKKIDALTAERDEYKKKWNHAKDKMNKPWSPPSNAKEMQKRFQQLGYRGNLR